MSVKEFFSLFYKNKYLLWLIVIINLAGTAFGIYYYWPQFVSVAPYLLPIVPDSPTATFLCAIALVFIFFRKEKPLLTNFAYFGLIKVGLWTLFTMVLYNHYFFAPENMIYYSILFVLHGGMVIEAFILQNKLSFKLRHWLPVVIFYLANDFFDYYVGTVPIPLPLDRPDWMIWLMIESVIVTLAIATYFAVKKREKLSQ